MSNKIQEKMDKNEYVIGPFVKINSSEIVEILGLAGFDYIIIDCEHGPLDMLSAQDMIRAAKLVGMSPVIRISDNDPAMISRALDIGADAVQIPQICTKEDAEKAIIAGKFAPLGERGVCRYVRAAEYSNVEKSKYFKKANNETMIIVQIEGKEGINNIDEILSVKGIDIIFIGPYDLSQSLGIIGDVNNPKIGEMVEIITMKAKACGKRIGIFVENKEQALKFIELGVQYISYSTDAGIILSSFKEVIQQFRK